jgi:hypothetical protein
MQSNASGPRGDGKRDGELTGINGSLCDCLGRSIVVILDGCLCLKGNIDAAQQGHSVDVAGVDGATVACQCTKAGWMIGIFNGEHARRGP